MAALAHEEEAAAQALAAEAAPQGVELKRCWRCKQQVDVFVAKGKNSFACRPCHALSNFVGKLEWPEELKLTAEQREAFYKSSRNCLDEAGRVSLERVRSEVGRVVKARTQEEYRAGGRGGFFPLKYYVDQGYDGKAIEAEAQKQWSKEAMGVFFDYCLATKMNKLFTLYHLR